MTAPTRSIERVLAIDPSPRGFGFAVLDGPDRLVDWGLKDVRKEKNSGCLRQINQLAELYEPTLIVVEDVIHGTRRCQRIVDLILSIHELGAEWIIRTRSLDRATIQAAFAESGVKSKEAIACALAERFPELAPKLPPPRKPWNGPDPRLAVFNALAMAVAAVAEAPAVRESKADG